MQYFDGDIIDKILTILDFIQNGQEIYGITTKLGYAFTSTSSYDSNITIDTENENVYYYVFVQNYSCFKDIFGTVKHMSGTYIYLSTKPFKAFKTEKGCIGYDRVNNQGILESTLMTKEKVLQILLVEANNNISNKNKTIKQEIIQKLEMAQKTLL